MMMFKDPNDAPIDVTTYDPINDVWNWTSEEMFFAI